MASNGARASAFEIAVTVLGIGCTLTAIGTLWWAYATRPGGNPVWLAVLTALHAVIVGIFVLLYRNWQVMRRDSE